MPGGLGENLTIAELDESGICVGDVHAIGSALLQVCQPRRPCFKLGLRFDDNSMVRALTQSGRAGWYYRVLQTGTIQAGDTVTLHDRPHADFAYARLIEIVSFGGATRDELQRMSKMPGLARQWRVLARQALAAHS